MRMRSGCGQKFVTAIWDFGLELPDNCRMAELGCYAGESALLWLSSGKVKSLLCVDLWSGADSSTVEPVFDRLLAAWMRSGVVKKVKSATVEAAKAVPDGSLDFVYIDADHSYEGCKADIETWLPKIAPGGVIGGHDYCDVWPGVMRAVNESFGKPEKTFADGSWLVLL